MVKRRKLFSENEIQQDGNKQHLQLEEIKKSNYFKWLIKELEKDNGGVLAIEDFCGWYMGYVINIEDRI